VRAILADTGPLYALRDPDDQFHNRAHEESRRFEQAGLSVVILWPTLLESYGLVLRRLTLADAQHWLAETRDGAQLINPTPEDYRQATERVRRYPDQPIILFDALVAVMSERLELPIWTFDHHFDVMRANVWR
jgi:predicted nucleic acid-binding protein